MRRRARVVELATEMLGSDQQARVAVLGAAFKPHSDDVRESPALWIASRLAETGHQVVVHDPKAIANARARFPDLAYCEDVEETLRDADIVLHLTEWPEYREIDPAKARGLTNGSLLVDGRNLLDAEAWRAEGWTVRTMGRP